MLKRFVKYYTPHKKILKFDLIFALLMSLVDLTFPVFSRQIVNVEIPNGNMFGIFTISLVMVGLYTFRAGFAYYVGYWGHVMGARIEYDMRKDLFGHLQTLSFRFFTEMKTGQIMSRLVGDLREISEVSHHAPEDLFISSVMIMGSFIILISINVPLTILVYVVVIILAIFAVQQRRLMRSSFRSVRNRHAEINEQLETSLSGIQLTQSLWNQDIEIEKFDMVNIEYRESWRSTYQVLGKFQAGTGFLSGILNITVLSVGGYFVYLKLINIGDLIMYLLFSNIMMQPIRRLIQFVQQFESGIAGFKRFCEIMDEKPEITDTDKSITLDHVEGKVCFKNVRFQYDEDNDVILHDFSMNIEKGKTIALVGPSGVGKTTISNLLLRFYDVNDGHIEIDDTDIKSIKLKSLRNHIGIVQQDAIIFWGSVYENILYGKPDATHEEVIEAAKNANIHEFISGLPNGYDTYVGEKGVKLSGGQKQRLSIARAFLKNPSILILDEATSSLDNLSEAMIQHSIEKVSKNRTTLIIAHRLSTIRHADQILVIADTGIEEKGTHEELLQKKGRYYSLYKAQYKGYIPD
ncbi:MAG: ABC transporter ATP-binding protein [Caldisericia bacterium]|nr:ABC transporter ATP-binding protein [Caldisericia bacterium]